MGEAGLAEGKRFRGNVTDVTIGAIVIWDDVLPAACVCGYALRLAKSACADIAGAQLLASCTHGFHQRRRLAASGRHSISLSSPDHPILVVDLSDTYLSVAEFPEIAGRTPFRCIPSELWGVDNNLNIANMDWEDFAGAAGEDGVFRGFDQ
jgi:Domain of unknown function (DUF6924)